MGRAATELAIQLLGGQHRLTPTNMHQVSEAFMLKDGNCSGVIFN